VQGMVGRDAMSLVMRMARPACLLLALLVFLSCAAPSYLLAQNSAESAQAEAPRDIYYKTGGEPVGPPAPAQDEARYPRYGSFDNRTFVWFVTQQHTYFGGFVLALPIFCVIIELIGLFTRDKSVAARYDCLARDFLRVSLLALSLTAVVGTLMLGMFIWLYPSFMRYMGGTFKAMMPVGMPPR